MDVLVNNAGLGGEVELTDMTDEQWFSVLDVTLTGTFRVTRAALNHMYGRGTGVIVNNASVLGWRAQAGQAHYAAAKAGICAGMYFIPPGMDPNFFVDKGFKLFTMPWGPWAQAGIKNALSGIKR